MTSRAHPALRLLLCLLGVLLVEILVWRVFESARHFAVTFNGASAPPVSTKLSATEWLFLTLFSSPALLGWVWFCRHTFDGLSLRSLGLHLMRATRGFLVGALGGVLALGILCGLLALLGEISFEWPSDFVFTSSPLEVAATLSEYALLFAAVGFFEELLFRGYLLHNLTAWLGSLPALLLQAALYAPYHLYNIYNIEAGHLVPHDIEFVGGLNLVLLGVFCALAYRKTGSLWFPIGFSAAWNFFLGCVFSLPVCGLTVPALLQTSYGQNLLTGGALGPEASLLLSPVLVALCYVTAQTSEHPQATLDLTLTNTGLLPPVEQVLPDVTDPEADRENRFRTRFGAGSPLEAQPLHIELPPLEPLAAVSGGEGGSEAALSTDATLSTETAPSTDAAFRIDVTPEAFAETTPAFPTSAPFQELSESRPIIMEEPIPASAPAPLVTVMVPSEAVPAATAEAPVEPDVVVVAPPVAFPPAREVPTSTPVSTPIVAPPVGVPPIVATPPVSPTPETPVPPKPKPASPRW